MKNVAKTLRKFKRMNEEHSRKSREETLDKRPKYIQVYK